MPERLQVGRNRMRRDSISGFCDATMLAICMERFMSRCRIAERGWAEARWQARPDGSANCSPATARNAIGELIYDAFGVLYLTAVTGIVAKVQVFSSGWSDSLSEGHYYVI